MRLAATECGVKGCGQIATKYPVVLIWAKGRVKCSHPPLELIFSLPVCQCCIDKGDKIGPNLITEEGWKQVCAAINQAGGDEPDRSSIEIRFDPISKWHQDLRK